MNKFRKDDRVSVEGVIASDHFFNGKAKVRFEHYNEAYFDIDELKMVKPAFLVGDIVIHSDQPRHAEVLAIVGDHLWVSFAIGDFATWHASLVRRVDPDPKPTAATREAEFEPLTLTPPRLEPDDTEVEVAF